MARSMETPEASDMAGGGRLDVPGKYHLLVEDIVDGIETKNDVLPGLSVRMKVLEGDQKDMIVSLSLLDGNLSHSDGGLFCRKKQSAFLVAANVLTPAQLNGANVDYDEEIARTQQIVAEFEFGKKDGEVTEYLDWKYCNIYHVDDPRAAKVPKSKEDLEMIPTEFRHDAKYFESLTGRSSKASSGSKKLKDSDFSDL